MHLPWACFSAQVAPAARRRGVASFLQRHQFDFIARELRIPCVRYTTNQIDPVPQAFALKCGMRLVHRAPTILHITDAAADYVERECALILAELLELPTSEPAPLLPHTDRNAAVVAHLIQTKLFGNGYLHADWKSQGVSAAVLAPHVSAGQVWTLHAPLAARLPADINGTRLPTSVSIFSGASGTKYTGTIGATSRAEFLLHLRTHLRQFAHCRTAVAASAPAAIASAYRFECWYSPALHPSAVGPASAGGVDALSERDVAAICAAPNPYTGMPMLVWERDLSPEIAAAAAVLSASVAQL